MFWCILIQQHRDRCYVGIPVELYKTYLRCIHAWSMKHVQCAASGEWTHHFCHLVAAQRKSLTCSLITASKHVQSLQWFGFGAIHCLFGSKATHWKLQGSCARVSAATNAYPRYNEGVGPADVQHAFMNNARSLPRARHGQRI